MAKWYAEFCQEAQEICARQERDQQHPTLTRVLTDEQLAALHARETWAYRQALHHWPAAFSGSTTRRSRAQRDAEARPFREARDEQFAVRRHITNIKHALDPERYVASNGVAGSPPPPPRRPDNPRDDREHVPQHDFGNER